MAVHCSEDVPIVDVVNDEDCFLNPENSGMSEEACPSKANQEASSCREGSKGRSNSSSSSSGSNCCSDDQSSSDAAEDARSAVSLAVVSEDEEDCDELL
eukprot:8509067-Karenia_brevis.AAC.1